MNRGAPVDIVTGEPMTGKNRQTRKPRSDEERLTELSGMINLDQATATQTVVKIAERLLMDEIEALLKDKPQVRLMIDMLNQIAGVQHNSRSIAHAIIARHGGTLREGAE